MCYTVVKLTIGFKLDILKKKKKYIVISECGFSDVVTQKLHILKDYGHQKVKTSPKKILRYR